MAKLTLFDFDGTITSKDTLFAFARSSTSAVKYWSFMLVLLPSFVLMQLGLMSKQRGKELFLKYFFGGLEIEKFNSLCEAFCQKVLRSLLRNGAVQSIKDFQSEGARVVIVSASPENWIMPWATQMNIEVIATKLDMVNGSITGKINGLNCNGPEKVNRIKAFLSLDDYDEIVAFGDSKGDMPMFSLANETHFKPFR